MASSTHRPFPFIWPTWITGLLAGDKQCRWAAWYRAHYRYEKRPDQNFDSAAWTASHNALVQRRKAALEADGWRVTLEGQNDFKLVGRTAVLSGKPDLLAFKDGQALVSDEKTGKKKNADFWQVLIYMLALPRKRSDLVRLRGEVVYSDDLVVPVAPEELTPQRSEQIFAMLRLVGGDEPPERVPSENECSFCDIAD